MQRRVDSLEQLLRVQRLHFRGRIVDHVHLMARGARFRNHALQDAVLARAPEIHLDAMAALELRDQLAQVLLRHRRVHVDDLLRPGAGRGERKYQQKRGQTPFHRFCVMVSMSAGCPALTRLMARLSAAATAPGLSIGPSAYQPIALAREAKSGAGSSMSMPM